MLLINKDKGVILEKDPVVNINFVNPTEEKIFFATLKSYYNILYTLEHE